MFYKRLRMVVCHSIQNLIVRDTMGNLPVVDTYRQMRLEPDEKFNMNIFLIIALFFMFWLASSISARRGV
jgi:hypothetical protein